MWPLIIGAVSQSGEIPIPSILLDGNTLGWYDHLKSDTITISEGQVTQWNDRINGINNLGSKTGNVIISADGVKFNRGTLRIYNIGLVLPYSYYLVVKINSYRLYDRLFVGQSFINNGTIQETRVNALSAYNGIDRIVKSFTVGNWHVIRLINAESLFQFCVDDSTSTLAITGNNPTGVALGGRVDGVQNSDITVKDFIIRRINDSETNQGIIYDYLKLKNGL